MAAQYQVDLTRIYLTSYSSEQTMLLVLALHKLKHVCFPAVGSRAAWRLVVQNPALFAVRYFVHKEIVPVLRLYITRESSYRLEARRRVSLSSSRCLVSRFAISTCVALALTGILHSPTSSSETLGRQRRRRARGAVGHDTAKLRRGASVGTGVGQQDERARDDRGARRRSPHNDGASLGPRCACRWEPRRTELAAKAASHGERCVQLQDSCVRN